MIANRCRSKLPEGRVAVQVEKSVEAMMLPGHAARWLCVFLPLETAYQERRD